MPDDSLSQREREDLRRLTALVAQRAAAETSLDERRQKVTVSAGRELQDTVTQADKEFAKQEAALTAERQRQDVEATRTFESALAAARRRMDTHLKNYNDRTGALNKAWTREHEESKWLAETLVESGEIKIRNEYEVSRKAIERRLAFVKGMHSEASQLLQERRHLPLPPLDEQPVEQEPAGSRDELGAASKSAYEEAEKQVVEGLHNAVRPYLLRDGAVVIVALAVAIGAGFAAFKLKMPQNHESMELSTYLWSSGLWRTILTWAGIAAAAAVAIMAALRIWARRFVPRAAAMSIQKINTANLSVLRTLWRARADRDRQGVELLAKRDEEMAKADRKLGAAKREVARRLNVNYPRLRDRHARRLAEIRARQDNAAAVIEAQFGKDLAAAQQVRDSKRQAGEEKAARRLRELEELDGSERGIIERHWKSGVQEARADLLAIRDQLTELCPPWSSEAWGKIRARDIVPPAVSFGHFDVDLSALPGGLSRHPLMQIEGPTAFTAPAMLDLFDRGSLFIHGGRDGGPSSTQLLSDVMLRLLTTFPPSKVRFTIIDPVGLGQSFAAFMHLADHDEQLVGGKIWTEPKHIEQRLTDLTEHMETVIQKYLRNEFETIQDYNAQAGEVAEPYRFLVIADFPANLTEAAAKRLASIAGSGAKCGLYTLIASTLSTDGKTRPPAWLPIPALEQSSAVLARKEGRFAWVNDELANWPLVVEQPPDEQHLTSILHQIGAAAKDAGRVQVPFEVVAPKPDLIWTLSSADEVRVPLGRAGAKSLQYFSLGRGTAQHALIAGRTGSGKSTFLHVLITNLALWYSPDEIELYLVDFKKGVEFKTYVNHALPHARVIAVESEREFGLSVLRRLDAELTRRGQLFREAGVQDVAGFRKTLKPGDPPLPRLLLVVDEFQEFFVEDDKLAQEAALLMDRIVRQGRAFGMHVVLGSQTLGGAYSIARSTLGQMAVRIALQCSEADSYLIMSEDNSAARLLNRPGEAIYNDMSGRIEGNSLFQIVWLPEEKRETHLGRLDSHRTPSGRRPSTIVFEGNIPADLARNPALAGQLSRTAAPTALPQVWLGEPISIKEPTAAAFRRQSGSNLLMVGQQEDAAATLMLSAVLSLAAFAGRVPPNSSGGAAPRLVVLDSTPADLAHARQLELAAKHWPGGARFIRPRDVGVGLTELSAELAMRERADHIAAPLFVVVFGLHRFRDLRKADDFSFSSSGDSAQTPAQQFARLLREGPPLGIHCVVWCDTAANIDRTFERSTLREFDSRVLFQMSAADSTHLIDAPTASTLGRHRALLHSEETGVTEKFRLYAPPDAAWLAAAWASIAAAQG